MSNPVDLSVPLSDIVRMWRQHRGLTQQQLSERASSALAGGEEQTMAKSYVSQLEIGRIAHPSAERLQALADALSIPVTYLLLRTPPGDEEPAPLPPRPSLQPSLRALAQLEDELQLALQHVRLLRTLLAGDDPPPDTSS